MLVCCAVCPVPTPSCTFVFGSCSPSALPQSPHHMLERCHPGADPHRTSVLPVDIYFPCNIAPALLPPRRGLVRVCYSSMFKEVLPPAPAAVSWLVDFFSHPLVLALVFFTGTLPPRQLLFVGVSIVLYGERTPANCSREFSSSGCHWRKRRSS
jgi:hypothetical protein